MRGWAKRLREASGWEAEVGYPADQTPEDFLDIVRINFLGSRDGAHPPPRPLLEEALELARSDGTIDRMLARILHGDPPAEVMAEVARDVAARVRLILRTGEGLRDNAPATIASKGYDAPLRDFDGPDRFEALLVSRAQRRTEG